jgi:hypothetical protein
MPPADDLGAFPRLVDALRPFLHELVFVGGWAHRLYRFHSAVSIPSHPPLFTEDADVVIPIPTSADNIRDRLLEKGFEEEFLGEDHPPITHYVLGDERSGFYAEFLTPLIGRAANDTAAVAGVVAQKLRYLDVLLVEPWELVLGRDMLTTAATIRVPNPVSYLAQKLLIQDKRKPEDQGKDVLYMHDTIELFGNSIGELRALWMDTVRSRLGKHAVKVEKHANAMFQEVTDPIRNAAQEAGGRGLAPEDIRTMCAWGLGEIFARPWKGDL